MNPSATPTLAPRPTPRLRSIGLLCTALLLSCGGSGSDVGIGVSAPVITALTPLPTTVPVGSATATLGLSLPSKGMVAAQLGVIIADGDPLSEAIAAYYQTARGIPAANIIRVKLATNSASLSATDFATLKTEIDAKLPSGVQATLLTWTAPSRVVGACTMSITSALALGFDSKYCGSGCVATATSPYFDSESKQPWTDHKIRPSMMLGARTLDAAKALIDRGVLADGSLPTGDGYLLRTSDSTRSVRASGYTPLPAQWDGRLKLNYIDNSAGTASDSLSGKTGVLFYFTGLAQVPGIASNGFRPGAVADHLTSYGGLLPSAAGQMPVTDWLDGGATASYGAVEEPCNFTQKFSNASVLIDQYYRGGSLIEAYWKSVQWPGQGLFVGEPLAQPFPERPSFTLESGRYLINTRALRPHSNYSLDYRSGASGSSGGNWRTLTSFNTTPAALQTLSAALPPGDALQLRWVGPCPTNSQQQCTLSSS